MSEINEAPVTESVVDTSIPPKLITRNAFGLINNGSVSYVYTPEGFVDWRKMINPKHLTINKQRFEKKDRPVPESIEGVDDRDLLILLPGIKELAQLRGYYNVRYSITSPAADYVVSVCSISWIPNFETNGDDVVFSSVGDASVFNTNNFGKSYLATIAENRSFVRAVRNFLKINIVSQEEITPSPISSQSETVDVSSEKLAVTMAEHGITFDKLKEKLIAEKVEGAENFLSISDIPKAKQFELVARIKKKAEEKLKSKKT